MGSENTPSSKMKNRKHRQIIQMPHGWFPAVLIFTMLVASLMPGNIVSAAYSNNPKLVQQASPCATNLDSSSTNSITMCITAPVNSSTVTGDVQVSVTITTSGSPPGVRRLVFYLNGQYLLTDYQSDYTFTLPTTMWKDGDYFLEAEALLRDNTVTQQRASVNLTFSNGIHRPPANNHLFTPSTGIPNAAGAPFIVAAAGDGAGGEQNATAVSDLITQINPNLFIYLGDVYEEGSQAEFYNWYGKQGTGFGRLRSITNPTIGNHEYDTGAPSGYFDYWDNIPNYYSYNAGGWHFVSINSNNMYMGTNKDSSQYQWLSRDLDAHPNTCTIVYYHHPLFNIGSEGSAKWMADMWAMMAAHGVDIVLNGHDHTYQHWQPLNGSGEPDPTGGITEFVAGAGGHGLQSINKSDPRVVMSIDQNPKAFGALKLALNPNGATFSYINASGAVLDSGVIPCHHAAADEQAPSSPTGLSAQADPNATQVNLTWTASSDDTGVNGYTLYRDGKSIAVLPAYTLNYVDAPLIPNQTYTYTLDAFDLAGNHSPPSAPVQITMPDLPPNLTFTAEADSYVNASSPDSNYGAMTSARVDQSPDLHAYLRFNITGLAGASVAGAHLLVYTNSGSGFGLTVQAVTDNSWNESSLNYINAPALGDILKMSGPMNAGSWAMFDVTPFVSGEGTYSFGVTTRSVSAITFATRESGENAPRLVIDLKSPAYP